MNDQQSSISEGSADILGGLLENILGSQAQNPSGAVSREGTSEGNAQNPFGDIFSSLLSNPDLLVKLPSIISAAKPIIEIFSQKGQSAPSVATTTESAPIITAPHKPDGKTERPHSREVECRNALLCAMKPYLSHDRQNAIDYILKLSRLGDILRTL